MWSTMLAQYVSQYKIEFWRAKKHCLEKITAVAALIHIQVVVDHTLIPQLQRNEVKDLAAMFLVSVCIALLCTFLSFTTI